MRMISRWTASRGSRCGGTPTRIIPPGTGSASKTTVSPPWRARALGQGRAARARGPGSHDRHASAGQRKRLPLLRSFAAGLGEHLLHLGPVIPRPIGDEALEAHDVDGRIGLGAVAGIFTAVIADSTADRGEWVILDDGAIGVGIAAFGNQRD